MREIQNKRQRKSCERDIVKSRERQKETEVDSEREMERTRQNIGFDLWLEQ